MNKAILNSFIILCLLSMLSLTECTISVKAGTNVIYVPDDYSTIQEAINNATSGDIIFVRSGIYYEHVTVNKSVSLVGEDPISTIVDGNGTGSVISIRANNVDIEGFTIKGSGTYPSDCGILVDHSNDINISDNIITDNYYGISLYFSSNNVFSGNTISLNNNDGISLYFSSNNVFSGNTISLNNNDGIGLYSSSNNVFSGNTISLNNNYGMYFFLFSKNNLIYLNNFNNTYQVWSDSANVWDDGDEGNYWTDYRGQDLNGDGIGESPYVIDANNQDNHPLMGMFSDFNVILKRETYNVTTISNSTIAEFEFEIRQETRDKILRFNVTGKDGTTGFCRITIPTKLMNYPYIVLVDAEEIVPTLLNVSSEAYVSLYFTYIHSSHTITIISSKTLQLYNELLDKYIKLQTDIDDLNMTYYDQLNNYSFLLGNYSQLQKSYQELNSSYYNHLLDYSKNVHNIRNLMHIFAATTAIFIATTIYLSKHAHLSRTKAMLRAREYRRLNESSQEDKTVKTRVCKQKNSGIT